MTSAGVGVAVHLDGFTAAGLAAHRALAAAGGSPVRGPVRCLGGESERVVVRFSFFARFYEASGASARDLYFANPRRNRFAPE